MAVAAAAAEGLPPAKQTTTRTLAMGLREGQSLAAVEAEALADATSNKTPTDQRKTKRGCPQPLRQPRNHFLPLPTMRMMARFALFAPPRSNIPRCHLATTEHVTFARSGFEPCIKAKAVPIVG